ncbi:unnamed protein product [Adineta ricciae]|uniref:Uncharacterized protein n=1 Tax=Adineta ricciae TaxID=249248 RepID=A0A815EWB1_ADIRI|nr:unnamed protein product [Adineta ricciae]CAF1317522.1 unnamed protein product [Adineta ricciae]
MLLTILLHLLLLSRGSSFRDSDGNQNAIPSTMISSYSNATDADWYRNEMTTKVVPLYNAAYRILHDDIIQRILRFDESLTESKNIDTSTINLSQEYTPVIVGGNDSKLDEIASITEEDSSIIEAQDNTTDQEEKNVRKRSIIEETTYAALSSEDNDSDHMSSKSVSNMEINVRLADEAELDSYELTTMSDDIITNEITKDIPVTKAVDTTQSSVISIDQANDEQNRLKVLANDIGIAANSVYKHLENASLECEHLRNNLNIRIMEVTENVSQHESELEKLQLTIESLAASIHIAEQEVTFAQQLVREQEVAVQNAQHQHDAAWDRVRKARLCRSGRRKKRFIGGWWYRNIERPISQAVEFAIIKPVCSVANMGGIERAKDARDLTENALNNAQRQLTNKQQELVNKRAQHSNLEIRRNHANAEKQQLQTQLAEMQTNYAAISSVLKQFQLVKVHLSSILISSKSLRTEIKQLLDFELVIEPLKALAEQMIKDRLMSSFNFQISSSIINQVDQILDRLSDKLELLPLLNINASFSEEDITLSTVGTDADYNTED